MEELPQSAEKFSAMLRVESIKRLIDRSAHAIRGRHSVEGLRKLRDIVSEALLFGFVLWVGRVGFFPTASRTLLRRQRAPWRHRDARFSLAQNRATRRAL
jgi:hypothetical protein